MATGGVRSRFFTSRRLWPESQSRLDELRLLMEALAREYAALNADDPRRGEIITEMLTLTSTQAEGAKGKE